MIRKVMFNELTNLGVDYHYLYNKKESVTYPYATGEYLENGYDFETNRYDGSFILELWNRGTNAELIELSETIKEHFKIFERIIEGESVSIAYTNSSDVRTNEEELYKVEMYFDTVRWKGQ